MRHIIIIKMKSFVASCALVAVSQAVLVEDQASDFAAWMVKFNKSYATTAIKTAKFDAWKINDNSIKALNNDKKNTFTVGHNQFSDLTSTEHAKLLVPARAKSKYNTHAQTSSAAEGACKCPAACGVCDCNEYGTGQAAKTVDWRTPSANLYNLSAINPITDQGLVCAASWAFADTALMESSSYIEYFSLGATLQ